jgi:hypothetical protein
VRGKDFHRVFGVTAKRSEASEGQSPYEERVLVRVVCERRVRIPVSRLLNFCSKKGDKNEDNGFFIKKIYSG